MSLKKAHSIDGPVSGKPWIFLNEIDMGTWGRKMMREKIQILIDNNERGSTRTHALILAASSDVRFETPKFAELDVDAQFRYNRGWGEYGEPKVVFRDPIDIYNVEFKETDDYVSTVLGKYGHGYTQYLAMAESGNPSMFLVLGSDQDVSDAIYDSLKTRHKGKELSFQIGSYEKRIIDFESQCEALHCPVERWEKAPYSRLLSRVAKVLLGASLMGYSPRPEENERQAACLKMAYGIGEKTAFALMADYGSISNL